jgi:hypothetical protein
MRTRLHTILCTVAMLLVVTNIDSNGAINDYVETFDTSTYKDGPNTTAQPSSHQNASWNSARASEAGGPQSH